MAPPSLSRVANPKIAPKTTFHLLPRELRDDIYSQLVVTSQPIRFDPLFGPLAYDIPGFNLLSGWNILPQMTPEACEIFYRTNLFEVFTDDLPLMLGANMWQWTLHEDAECRDSPKERPPSWFDTKLYITHLKIVVQQNRHEKSLADDLGDLLECQRLKYVTLEVCASTWRCLGSGSKCVLEELRRRIGGGLVVGVEGEPRGRGVEYWN